MKTNVTKQILYFKDLLCAASKGLNHLLEDQEANNKTNLIREWTEVNWELFLEKELFGNDLTIAALSIDKPLLKVLPPKKIVDTAIVASNNQNKMSSNQKVVEELRVVNFETTNEKGGFEFNPPFDLVVLYDDKSKTIYREKIVNLEFFAVPFIYG